MNLGVDLCLDQGFFSEFPPPLQNCKPGSQAEGEGGPRTQALFLAWNVRLQGKSPGLIIGEEREIRSTHLSQDVTQSSRPILERQRHHGTRGWKLRWRSCRRKRNGALGWLNPGSTCCERAAGKVNKVQTCIPGLQRGLSWSIEQAERLGWPWQAGSWFYGSERPPWQN